MTERDVRRVVDIASVCYPEHPEDMAIFMERLRLYPEGCLSLAQGDGLPEGYVLSYPWTRETAPPLNALVLGLPGDAQVYYIHDLALMPPLRRKGHAESLLALLDAGPAAPFERMSLVSVNGTVPFWEGHGFAVVRTPAIDEKLASYGPSARYMERPL